jgi:PhzF family phenazine biosynthesis protein
MTQTYKVDRLAAFSDGNEGGNPAGVVVCDELPTTETMQRIAAEVGYSETVFAAPQGDGWRVRYFAPVGEVAFCGHATIALGAQLARRFGNRTFQLSLNHADITVQGRISNGSATATLTSPPTYSHPADHAVLSDALALFSLSPDDLLDTLKPAIANAGNDHLILTLRDRATLAAMDYDLEEGAAFMAANSFTTVSLLFVETPNRFHSRNAFASGGVLEDPATGAAAAALAGYLRDLDWPHGGHIDIIQGEDIGARSLLRADITATPGEGIKVSGAVRTL